MSRYREVYLDGLRTLRAVETPGGRGIPGERIVATDLGDGGVSVEATGGFVETLDDRAPLLWGLAVGFYGVGDLCTTVVGLTSGRAVEAGPIASVLVDQYGLVAVFPLKIGSLLVFYLFWRVVPRPHAIGIPLGLAALGTLLTVWNTLVLLGLTPTP